MVTVNTVFSRSATTVLELTALFDSAAKRDGVEPIGEQKRVHLSRDSDDWTGVFARDDQNRLVGYGHLRWTGEATPSVFLETVIALDTPDAATVAETVVTAATDVVANREGGTVYAWAHGVTNPNDTVYARLGWSVQRQLAVMEQPLHPVPFPLPPKDVRIATFHSDDRAALLDVNNAAFASHPENGGWTMAELDRRLAQSWVDPEAIFMAWDTRDDQLLGFHWTKRHPCSDHERPIGEVYILAVSPSAQGRGLGRALLNHGLAHLSSFADRAILYVDADDPGPVRLYTTSGFTVTAREVCYELDVE